MARAGDQPKLFDTGISLPNGFVYRPDFISVREEEILLEIFKDLPLENATFEGYTARRRIMNFGWSFDDVLENLVKMPPLPDFLLPLQRKVAKWLDVPVTQVVEALVTEYQPGTPIGWHRDRGAFDSGIGISLGSWCTMRLRPLEARDVKNPAKEFADKTFNLPLEPRSAYLMQGESRWEWQHSIPPTTALRYSITFRTMPKGAVLP